MANHKGVSIGLRVNPEFSESPYDLYNPCKPGSRFGVTAEQLGDTLPEGVEGFHFHTLFEADSLALENVLAVFEKKFRRFLSKLKWVNMGGRHLITGRNLSTHHLITLLKGFKKKYEVGILLEPGSAFTYQTGYLVSTILDIVENNGIKTAILDVSFACHMPDCLEMPYKPAILGGTDEKIEKPTYRMGGISCLAGDFMGNWSFDKKLKPGDKIIFVAAHIRKQAGRHPDLQRHAQIEHGFTMAEHGLFAAVLLDFFQVAQQPLDALFKKPVDFFLADPLGDIDATPVSVTDRPRVRRRERVRR